MVVYVYCETHGEQVTSHPAPGDSPSCPKCSPVAANKEDHE